MPDTRRPRAAALMGFGPGDAAPPTASPSSPPEPVPAAEPLPPPDRSADLPLTQAHPVQAPAPAEAPAPRPRPKTKPPARPAQLTVYVAADDLALLRRIALSESADSVERGGALRKPGEIAAELLSEAIRGRSRKLRN
jgi:hypothetical protein